VGAAGGRGRPKAEDGGFMVRGSSTRLAAGMTFTDEPGI